MTAWASIATCSETIPEEGECSRWAVLQHKGLFAPNSSRESREDCGIRGCTQPAPLFPSYTQAHKRTEVFHLNCQARFQIHWLPPSASLQIHWYPLCSAKFNRLCFKCIPPWRLTSSPFTVQALRRKSKTAKRETKTLHLKSSISILIFSKDIWVWLVSPPHTFIQWLPSTVLWLQWCVNSFFKKNVDRSQLDFHR